MYLVGSSQEHICAEVELKSAAAWERSGNSAYLVPFQRGLRVVGCLSDVEE
jgi:hypothetical protein